MLEWANANKKTISASFSNACTNLPASGDFTVFRVENGGFLATMFAVRVQDRKMFVSYFNTGVWSDWAEYVINSDLQSHNLITAPVNDSHLTANIEYRIKAGVCYVTVYWININSTVASVVLNNNMPIPIIHCYAPITDHNNGDNLGLIFIDTGQTILYCRARKTGVGFSSFSYPIA